MPKLLEEGAEKERVPLLGRLKVLLGVPTLWLPKLPPVLKLLLRFTVDRVLLSRGMPKEREPLVELLGEPNERLRRGLSLPGVFLMLPNERVPLLLLLPLL